MLWGFEPLLSVHNGNRKKMEVNSWFPGDIIWNLTRWLTLFLIKWGWRLKIKPRSWLRLSKHGAWLQQALIWPAFDLLSMGFFIMCLYINIRKTCSMFQKSFYTVKLSLSKYMSAWVWHFHSQLWLLVMECQLWCKCTINNNLLGKLYAYES